MTDDERQLLLTTAKLVRRLVQYVDLYVDPRDRASFTERLLACELSRTRPGLLGGADT